MFAIEILRFSVDDSFSGVKSPDSRFEVTIAPPRMLKAYGANLWKIIAPNRAQYVDPGKTENSAMPLCWFDMPHPLEAGKYILTGIVGGLGAYEIRPGLPIISWDWDDGPNRTIEFAYMPQEGLWAWTIGHPFPYPQTLLGTEAQARASWESHKHLAGEDLPHRTKFYTFRGKSAPYPTSFEEYAWRVR